MGEKATTANEKQEKLIFHLFKKCQRFYYYIEKVQNRQRKKHKK